MPSLATVAVCLVVGFGLFLRLWILGRNPLTADQAVVGLMAREILKGHLFTFYWGQPYGGGEPYVVAALFAVLGQSRLVLGLAPLLLDAIAALLVWRIGRRLFDPRVGVLAALIFWIWPEVYLYLSTVEYGFRYLTLVCGLAVLLVALRLTQRRPPWLGDWAAFGLFVGVGWWCSPEIVYFAVPSLALLAFCAIRGRLRPRLAGLALCVAAAILGALPWLAANVGSGFPSLRAPANPATTWLERARIFVEKAMPMALGLRVRGTGAWIAGAPVSIVLYTLLAAAFLTWIAVLCARRRALVLVVFVAFFPFAYTYSTFSWYWSDGRYALYVAPVLALLAASAVYSLTRPRRLARAAPALALVAALGMTVATAVRVAPYAPLAAAGSVRHAVDHLARRSRPVAAAARRRSGALGNDDRVRRLLGGLRADVRRGRPGRRRGSEGRPLSSLPRGGRAQPASGLGVRAAVGPAGARRGGRTPPLDPGRPVDPSSLRGLPEQPERQLPDRERRVVHDRATQSTGATIAGAARANVMLANRCSRFHRASRHSSWASPERLRVQSAAIAALLAALLCGGLVWGLAAALATSSSPAPAAKVVLRIGLTGGSPDSLNPFAGQNASCYEIWSLNYDLLVGFSAGDYGHPQGAAATGLADRWTVSDGGKVWTFHIRSGVTWQDGVPLTAKDVAFTYNYVIKNQLSNYTAYTNFITSVTAPNDNTVVFTCSKPKANMLDMRVYIVPEHIWETVPGQAVNDYEDSAPIVGSGPFQLTSYKPGDEAVMTANKKLLGRRAQDRRARLRLLPRP